MNPLTQMIARGTFGEGFVQLKLLQFDVQSAPPIKDSGNDLIAMSHGTGHFRAPHGYTDRVAEAVSAVYPERAMAIYTAALNAQLPHAQQSSYESATASLRKLRPLYEALDRASEWTALVASIREKYRNRPRFMDLLNGLEARSIPQSAPMRWK